MWAFIGKKLLTRVLPKIFSNFSPDSLSWSHILLKSLMVNKTLLVFPNCPYSVDLCSLEELEIQIPWSDFFRKNSKVRVSGLKAHFTLKEKSEWENCMKSVEEITKELEEKIVSRLKREIKFMSFLRSNSSNPQGRQLLSRFGLLALRIIEIEVKHVEVTIRHELQEEKEKANDQEEPLEVIEYILFLKECSIETSTEGEKDKGFRKLMTFSHLAAFTRLVYQKNEKSKMDSNVSIISADPDKNDRPKSTNKVNSQVQIIRREMGSGPSINEIEARRALMSNFSVNSIKSKESIQKLGNFSKKVEEFKLMDVSSSITIDVESLLETKAFIQVAFPEAQIKIQKSSLGAFLETISYFKSYSMHTSLQNEIFSASMTGLTPKQRFRGIILSQMKKNFADLHRNDVSFRIKGRVEDSWRRQFLAFSNTLFNSNFKTRSAFPNQSVLNDFRSLIRHIPPNNMKDFIRLTSFHISSRSSFIRRSTASIIPLFSSSSSLLNNSRALPDIASFIEDALKTNGIEKVKKIDQSWGLLVKITIENGEAELLSERKIKETGNNVVSTDCLHIGIDQGTVIVEGNMAEWRVESTVLNVICLLKVTQPFRKIYTIIDKTSPSSLVDFSFKHSIAVRENDLVSVVLQSPLIQVDDLALQILISMFTFKKELKIFDTAETIERFSEYSNRTRIQLKQMIAKGTSPDLNIEVHHPKLKIGKRGNPKSNIMVSSKKIGITVANPKNRLLQDVYAKGKYEVTGLKVKVGSDSQIFKMDFEVDVLVIGVRVVGLPNLRVDGKVTKLEGSIVPVVAECFRVYSSLYKREIKIMVQKYQEKAMMKKKKKLLKNAEKSGECHVVLSEEQTTPIIYFFVFDGKKLHFIDNIFFPKEIKSFDIFPGFFKRGESGLDLDLLMRETGQRIKMIFSSRLIRKEFIRFVKHFSNSWFKATSLPALQNALYHDLAKLKMKLSLEVNNIKISLGNFIESQLISTFYCRSAKIDIGEEQNSQKSSSGSPLNSGRNKDTFAMFPDGVMMGSQNGGESLPLRGTTLDRIKSFEEKSEVNSSGKIQENEVSPRRNKMRDLYSQSQGANFGNTPSQNAAEPIQNTHYSLKVSAEAQEISLVAEFHHVNLLQVEHLEVVYTETEVLVALSQTLRVVGDIQALAPLISNIQSIMEIISPPKALQALSPMKAEAEEIPVIADIYTQKVRVLIKDQVSVSLCLNNRVIGLLGVEKDSTVLLWVYRKGSIKSRISITRAHVTDPTNWPQTQLISSSVPFENLLGKREIAGVKDIRVTLKIQQNFVQVKARIKEVEASLAIQPLLRLVNFISGDLVSLFDDPPPMEIFHPELIDKRSQKKKEGKPETFSSFVIKSNQEGQSENGFQFQSSSSEMSEEEPPKAQSKLSQSLMKALTTIKKKISFNVFVQWALVEFDIHQNFQKKLIVEASKINVSNDRWLTPLRVFDTRVASRFGEEVIRVKGILELRHNVVGSMETPKAQLLNSQLDLEIRRFLNYDKLQYWRILNRDSTEFDTECIANTDLQVEIRLTPVNQYDFLLVDRDIYLFIMAVVQNNMTYNDGKDDHFNKPKTPGKNMVIDVIVTPSLNLSLAQNKIKFRFNGFKVVYYSPGNLVDPSLFKVFIESVEAEAEGVLKAKEESDGEKSSSAQTGLNHSLPSRPVIGGKNLPLLKLNSFNDPQIVFQKFITTVEPIVHASTTKKKLDLSRENTSSLGEGTERKKTLDSHLEDNESSSHDPSKAILIEKGEDIRSIERPFRKGSINEEEKVRSSDSNLESRRRSRTTARNNQLHPKNHKNSQPAFRQRSLSKYGSSDIVFKGQIGKIMGYIIQSKPPETLNQENSSDEDCDESSSESNNDFGISDHEASREENSSSSPNHHAPIRSKTGVGPSTKRKTFLQGSPERQRDRSEEDSAVFVHVKMNKNGSKEINVNISRLQFYALLEPIKIFLATFKSFGNEVYVQNRVLKRFSASSPMTVTVNFDETEFFFPTKAANAVSTDRRNLSKRFGFEGVNQTLGEFTFLTEGEMIHNLRINQVKIEYIKAIDTIEMLQAHNEGDELTMKLLRKLNKCEDVAEIRDPKFSKCQHATLKCDIFKMGFYYSVLPMPKPPNMTLSEYIKQLYESNHNGVKKEREISEIQWVSLNQQTIYFQGVGQEFAFSGMKNFFQGFTAMNLILSDIFLLQKWQKVNSFFDYLKEVATETTMADQLNRFIEVVERGTVNPEKINYSFIEIGNCSQATLQVRDDISSTFLPYLLVKIQFKQFLMKWRPKKNKKMRVLSFFPEFFYLNPSGYLWEPLTERLCLNIAIEWVSEWQKNISVTTSSVPPGFKNMKDRHSKGYDTMIENQGEMPKGNQELPNGSYLRVNDEENQLAPFINITDDFVKLMIELKKGQKALMANPIKKIEFPLESFIIENRTGYLLAIEEDNGGFGQDIHTENVDSGTFFKLKWDENFLLKAIKVIWKGPRNITGSPRARGNSFGSRRTNTLNSASVISSDSGEFVLKETNGTFSVNQLAWRVNKTTTIIVQPDSLFMRNKLILRGPLSIHSETTSPLLLEHTIRSMKTTANVEKNLPAYLPADALEGKISFGKFEDFSEEIPISELIENSSNRPKMLRISTEEGEEAYLLRVKKNFTHDYEIIIMSPIIVANHSMHVITLQILGLKEREIAPHERVSLNSFLFEQELVGEIVMESTKCEKFVIEHPLLASKAHKLLFPHDYKYQSWALFVKVTKHFGNITLTFYHKYVIECRMAIVSSSGNDQNADDSPSTLNRKENVPLIMQAGKQVPCKKGRLFPDQTMDYYYFFPSQKKMLTITDPSGKTQELDFVKYQTVNIPWFEPSLEKISQNSPANPFGTESFSMMANRTSIPQINFLPVLAGNYQKYEVAVMSSISSVSEALKTEAPFKKLILSFNSILLSELPQPIIVSGVDENGVTHERTYQPNQDHKFPLFSSFSIRTKATQPSGTISLSHQLGGLLRFGLRPLPQSEGDQNDSMSEQVEHCLMEHIIRDNYLLLRIRQNKHGPSLTIRNDSSFNIKYHQENCFKYSKVNALETSNYSWDLPLEPVKKLNLEFFNENFEPLNISQQITIVEQKKRITYGREEYKISILDKQTLKIIVKRELVRHFLLIGEEKKPASRISSISQLSNFYSPNQNGNDFEGNELGLIEKNGYSINIPSIAFSYIGKHQKIRKEILYLLFKGVRLDVENGRNKTLSLKVGYIHGDNYVSEGYAVFLSTPKPKLYLDHHKNILEMKATASVEKGSIYIQKITLNLAPICLRAEEETILYFMRVYKSFTTILKPKKRSFDELGFVDKPTLTQRLSNSPMLISPKARKGRSRFLGRHESVIKEEEFDDDRGALIDQEESMLNRNQSMLAPSHRGAPGTSTGDRKRLASIQQEGNKEKVQYYINRIDISTLEILISYRKKNFRVGHGSEGGLEEEEFSGSSKRIRIHAEEEEREEESESLNQIYSHFSRLGLIIPNLEDAKISLPPLKTDNWFSSLDSVRESFIKHYKFALFKASLQVIGSLNFLGNPVKVFREVGEGIKELVDNPKAQIIEGGGAKQILSGIKSGTMGFLAHTASALSGGLNKIMRSSGDYIALASMDQDFIDSRSRRSNWKYRDVQTNREIIKTGFDQLSYGMQAGLSSYNPVSHIKTGGFKDVIRSAYLSHAGAIFKPLAGLLDASSYTTEELKRLTDIDDQRVSQTWIKKPRIFYGKSRSLKGYHDTHSKMAARLEQFPKVLSLEHPRIVYYFMKVKLKTEKLEREGFGVLCEDAIIVHFKANTLQADHYYFIYLGGDPSQVPRVDSQIKMTYILFCTRLSDGIELYLEACGTKEIKREKIRKGEDEKILNEQLFLLGLSEKKCEIIHNFLMDKQES